MYLRWIAQNRPRVIGNGELQPDVFREGIFDNVFKILQQVCGLDFDSFTFQSAREREHLTDNIRATFCTYLCCSGPCQ
jgi:hypothetical protein